MTKHSTLALVAAALLLGACGVDDGAPLTAEDGSALQARNGLSRNGLSRNGLSRNGLSRNGLSRNGLSRNGLLTADFTTWFNQDPAGSAEVMTYVVKCAMSRTQTLTYTSTAGVSYTWPGNLGLAPVWSSGQLATTAEEQLVTACLAAHVNKFGINLDLSIRGYKTNGTAIPLDPGEETTFTEGEGCFFGNLFADQGVFVGYNNGTTSQTLSTPRGCAIESGTAGDCPPLQNVAKCINICTRTSGQAPWQSCSYNGVTYKPISTYLKQSDVYVCGDGVCQFTESQNTCSKDCF